MQYVDKCISIPSFICKNASIWSVFISMTILPLHASNVFCFPLCLLAPFGYLNIYTFDCFILTFRLSFCTRFTFNNRMSAITIGICRFVFRCALPYAPVSLTPCTYSNLTAKNAWYCSCFWLRSVWNHTVGVTGAFQLNKVQFSNLNAANQRHNERAVNRLK